MQWARHRVAEDMKLPGKDVEAGGCFGCGQTPEEMTANGGERHNMLSCPTTAEATKATFAEKVKVKAAERM